MNLILLLVIISTVSGDRGNSCTVLRSELCLNNVRGIDWFYETATIWYRNFYLKVYIASSWIALDGKFQNLLYAVLEQKSSTTAIVPVENVALSSITRSKLKLPIYRDKLHIGFEKDNRILITWSLDPNVKIYLSRELLSVQINHSFFF